MSDIVKDAAIVALAREAMGVMDATAFLGRYAGDSEEDWDYYTGVLYDFDLAREIIKPKPWYETDPAWSRPTEYIWTWKTD